MALKSTIYKVELNVADMDRHFYSDFQLTLACHPSETTERMMLRLLAFARHASEQLEFGRGISTDDEPDLWQKDLTGDIELWIELGTPDPDRLRKACGRSKRVVLYCYGERAVPIWWEKHRSRLERFDNLEILQVDQAGSDELAALAQPSMRLQCTMEGADAWFSCGDQAVQITSAHLKR